MPYKYLFFDLDGTLIDPKLGITTAVQHALKQYNIDEHPENLKHFIGPPMDKSFQKHYDFSHEQSHEAVQHFRNHYLTKGMFESEPYDGIIHLLEKLQMAKKTLCVVTTKPTNQAEILLNHHKMKHFFKHIVGSKPDLSDADKTSLVKAALAFFPNENKNDFVMIGDKEFDIIGAKENDIDSIGVLYGYGTNEEISNAKPTHIATTVEDLAKYL